AHRGGRAGVAAEETGRGAAPGVRSARRGGSLRSYRDGLGCVHPVEASQEQREALRPPLEHRRGLISPRLKNELEYRPDETVRSWLARHGRASGGIDPARVPGYLLLAGPPEAIPFRFQYELGLEYVVGRLSFDSPQDYARYAQSVIRYET